MTQEQLAAWVTTTERYEVAAFAGEELSSVARVRLIAKHATALIALADGRLVFEAMGFAMRQPICARADIEEFSFVPGSRVLVIDLRMIGDTVQAGEFCALLRERFGIRVSYLGLNGCARVLGKTGICEQLHDFSAKAIEIGGITAVCDEAARLCRELAGEYDTVINLNQTILAMLLAQAAATVTAADDRTVRVYGWTFDARNRGVFRGNRFFHRLFADAYLHLQEQMFRCAALAMPARASQRMFSPIQRRGMIPRGAVGFFVGARIATRQWTKEGWIGCAKELVAQGRAVVIFGGASEQSIAAAVKAVVPEVIDLCGELPLDELGSVMACCDLLITTDSGGKHAAVSGDVPCVEVSGAGNRFEQCGPYAARSVVIQRDEPCLHCLKNDCEHQRCMSGLSADAVLVAVKAVLAGDGIYGRLRDAFSDDFFSGYSVWYSGDARPDLCFVPVAARHAYSADAAFDRMKGFCDDALVAAANERSTGVVSAHTATEDVVAATWETFSVPIREDVRGRIVAMSEMTAVAAETLSSMTEVGAIVCFCETSLPRQAGWITRANIDLSLLSALPGPGDNEEALCRALKNDIAAYAGIWMQMRTWTESA